MHVIIYKNNSERMNMEYPVIECKEGNITFWNVVFPMIFAFSFGGVGFSCSTK